MKRSAENDLETGFITRRQLATGDGVDSRMCGTTDFQARYERIQIVICSLNLDNHSRRVVTDESGQTVFSCE